MTRTTVHADETERPLRYEHDLSQQLARIAPALLFRGATVDELRAWQGRFRERLVESLWTIPERGPLDLAAGAETDCGAYVRRRVTYQSEPGVRVPAWLLVPKDVSAARPAPGVLFLHGHSDFGKDNVVRIDASPERRAELARVGERLPDL
jgi:hypothetical protein